MDAFDKITKLVKASGLDPVDKCKDIFTFTQLVAKIGLPLNVTKEVACACNVAVLG